MIEESKKIQNLEVNGKTVLLRVDFNAPVLDGVIQDLTRILSAKSTVDYLVNSKAKVLLLSHFGRPKGRSEDLSMKVLLAEIQDVLETKVSFVSDCIGDEVKGAIEKMEGGDVLLLENVRFYEEEEIGDLDFAKKLSMLADIYVNDAFSCSHRNHSSIVGITKFLPSYLGLSLQNEIENLSILTSLDDQKKPFVAIIGGSKVSTKLKLLLTLAKKADYLIIVGAMANNFLLYKHLPIGKSLIENDAHALIKNIYKVSEESGCQILLPLDVGVARTIKSRIAVIKDAISVNTNESIFDVGPKTIDSIRKIVFQSKLVIWNGPAGAFEHLPFANGTFAIVNMLAKATEELGVITIVGGGESVSAIHGAKVDISKISYVSTGGGAFLEWISNDCSLPGLKAIGICNV